METLWVSAGIELTPGTDAAIAEQALQLLMEQTSREPGCILFEIRQQKADPSKFTLWECWVNQAALTAHFEAQHTLDYLAKNYTQVAYIEKLGKIGAHRTAANS
ncbi:antibiotic biosynthesis monooxygenase [Roseibium polysiphoniae]|uniref:putative quinol monooxygenase n=1 Tax=Roseibium polysiphoniae TaxID=2571221 RepID=UPI003299A5CD